ncbi:MAG: 3-phosphoshikimate 1-carboxyvinyltransferase [Spirochaetaceae bacterium]|nr:MAG: 3-phosphoshikimate 1-carboxyvinyltransferase [Spirochaetaceae bacterium]
MTLSFQAPRGLSGRIIPPPDKSITHRALLVAGIARGRSLVHNPLNTGDCVSTRSCLRSLGVSIKEIRKGQGEFSLEIEGRGLWGFREPEDVLDAGNSGTTARLLTGLLAGQKLFAVLNGDHSLQARPMLRVVEPLRSMGAEIQGRNGGRNLPLVFVSSSKELLPIDYRLEVPSAQVKSALLFAALRAADTVRIGGAVASRDHTERLYSYLGLPLRREGEWLSVQPVTEVPRFELTVPGDISSAAFFMTGALICGKELLVENCGLNPSRLGFVEVLKRMGARIEIEEQDSAGGEPRGSLRVLPGALRGVEIQAAEIPACIDEIPLLAVLGALAEGTTRVRGAEELRHKESDRLAAVDRLLSAVGGRLDVSEDGFNVQGPQALRSGLIDPKGDHRIAMSAAVLSAGLSGAVAISGFEAAEVSFPDFVGMFRALGGEVS